MARSSLCHLILLGWTLCSARAYDRGEFLQTLDHVDHHEIVYPKIHPHDSDRVRRGCDNGTPHMIEIKDWILETSVNEELIISPNFVAQWIHSGRSRRDLGVNMLQDCQVRHGSVRGVESVVAVTICEADVYGSMHLRNETFFIHPLTDGQHVLYKSTTAPGPGKGGGVRLKHDETVSRTNRVGRDANVNSFETKHKIRKLKRTNEERPEASMNGLLENKNSLWPDVPDLFADAGSREESIERQKFEKSSRELDHTEDVNLEKIDVAGEEIDERNVIDEERRHEELFTDFDLIANTKFSDLLLLSDNDLDVYLREKVDILNRLRDHLDDIWLYGNLNKSMEVEISAGASGHGAGPEFEYGNDRDLNVKLADGSTSSEEEEEVEGIARRRKREKRDLMICNTREFHNLTGDMIDVVEDGKRVEDEGESGEREPDDFPFEEDSEHIGYFFDRAWERDKLPKRKPLAKEAPPRWLELGIAVDYSVVDFHGSRVQQYILALLNIVSAIYKDPSLESNMKLVIVRMVFYAEKKDGIVREGNARQSLENVNRWNHRFLESSEESHDVAVWLTRLDIGGPSGYAPVSGACDPTRSCALNRDEGLTSAFIIAHEVAHILGLRHDGDVNAGNTCGDASTMGSVMAPMVAATFHRFHWSTCSKKEFHHWANEWSCLLNQPEDTNTTDLKATIQETFTMNEQCRMEFGEGYSLCRSFALLEPCSHLWCGHTNSSQVCKTKKGPPLEGTACGEDRWCVNGYCEQVDRQRFGLGPVIHNSRDGGWSSWSSWGRCSRSCGVGVQFRTRKCNRPTPAYGGANCKGKNEEFQVCVRSRCPTGVDLRSQQCSRLVSLMGFKNTSPRHNMTWLAYEPDQESTKCQLACRSKQTGEVFFSGENLPDGTPCTYGGTDICVQGKCRRMGCDNVLNSDKAEDTCGECGGDNANCKNVTNRSQRKLRRGMSRIAVIPRSAHNIRVDVTLAQVPALYKNNVTVTIRDRRKRRNDVGSYDGRGRAQIIVVEGAAFRPQKLGDTYTVGARGPLFAEIVISFAVPDEAIKSGVSVSVFTRYTVHRNHENATERFSWLPGGWGPCSSSCGGGIRQKTVACMDEVTGRIVPKRKCPLTTKPIQEYERCNLLSCNFKWVHGQWEACTATCGDKGTQRRRIHCVHTSLAFTEVTKNNAAVVYEEMVPPDRCRHPPQTERECNRIPCRGSWSFTDWSSCSQTCGRGVQSRMARCVPPEGESLFECGSVTPKELRSCKGLGRRNLHCTGLCERDRSEYCSLPVLKRYCDIPGFKSRCCQSCR